MNNSTSLQERIKSLLTWKQGARRAPHKPLMLLFAISKLQQENRRFLSFEEVEKPLSDALNHFGPAGRVPTPQYPFWRLLNDGLWEVKADGDLTRRKSNSDPTKSSLIKSNAKAGFAREYFDLLSSDSTFQTQIIHQILDSHFPTSIHEDIVLYFSLSVGEVKTSDAIGHSRFRENVLSTYNSRCAISGYRGYLNGSPVGIEAAHICWPQAGGLNDIVNGIALSSLHRKLFHLGAFTIDGNYRLVVSPRFDGDGLICQQLAELSGKSIQLPNSREFHPSQRCLSWHSKEVFRS